MSDSGNAAEPRAAEVGDNAQRDPGERRNRLLIKVLCTVAIVADIAWIFTGVTVTVLFYPKVVSFFTGQQSLQILDGVLHRFALGLPALLVMIWVGRRFEEAGTRSRHLQIEPR